MTPVFMRYLEAKSAQVADVDLRALRMVERAPKSVQLSPECAKRHGRRLDGRRLDDGSVGPAGSSSTD